MRETCARVLAAALMTGAIAAVVAMSALFGTPSQAGRPITAPPSSLQRSVRLAVRPAPPHRRRVERPVSAHRISTPARPIVVSRRQVTVHARRSQPPQRRLASTKPKARPAVTPAPDPVVPEPTSPAAPETSQVEAEPESDREHGEGKGNAYGHEKDHGHGHGGHDD